MATLQKIRNHGGLLVGIIFVALAAFLLGDAFRSGAFGSDTQVVGEIDGNKISIIDFQRKVDEISDVHKMSTGNMQLDEHAMTQVRNEVWRDYEYQIIFEPACEKLGLAVTSDELFDMVQGSNLHPAIQQMFTDPQTGQFSRTAVLNFLRAVNQGQVNQQQYTYWKYLESQIKRDRLASKYNALVAKGVYVTSLEAKNSLKEKNTAVDFNYVKLPYSLVSDSAVSVSNSEIKAYYNAHKEEYSRESSRTIQYVMLPIKATDADEKEAFAWIQDIRDEFATASDNPQFVNLNSDMAFDGNYLKEADVEDSLREFAFSAKVGDVYGPVRGAQAYTLVKLDSREMLPDSVKARHILLNPQTLGSLDAAQTMADSLKTVIEQRKTSFAELAERYSEDTGSASDGGDLGWFKRNQMVKPFEDAAFNGDVNKVYVITSQFGVHIIQPTAKGKTVEQVRLAELVRNIEPSAHTEDAVYANASKLATISNIEAFNSEVKEMGLNTRRASLSEDEPSVAGLEDSRSLIRAAYSANGVNDFLTDYEGTSIFKFGENFVLAHLAGVQEKGYADVADVTPSIRREIAKTKKAEQLSAKVSGSDLNAIAAKENAAVQSAAGVNFGMQSVPTLGVEPAVVGTATNLAQGSLSKAIAGNNGIYVLKNTAVNTAATPADAQVYAEQARLNSNYAYRINYQSFDVLKDKVEVEDNRVRFF
ncbi:MAG: SurA N-terminal domain-containing protein [Mangrovibacterium sp.]